MCGQRWAKNNEKLNKIGYILLGVGMIFLGLEVMSMSVDEIIYDTLPSVFGTPVGAGQKAACC